MQVAVLQVNWTAVIAAFVAYYALGALWFAGLFSRQYKASLGLPQSAKASTAPIFFVGPAVCTLLVVVVSAILMKGMNIASYGEAMIFGAVVGMGYMVATTINTAINPLFPRPLHYGLVSGGYHLVGMLVSCVILVAIP
jgi:hypothetical protein